MTICMTFIIQGTFQYGILKINIFACVQNLWPRNKFRVAEQAHVSWQFKSCSKKRKYF